MSASAHLVSCMHRTSGLSSLRYDNPPFWGKKTTNEINLTVKFLYSSFTYNKPFYNIKTTNKINLTVKFLYSSLRYDKIFYNIETTNLINPTVKSLY